MDAEDLNRLDRLVPILARLVEDLYDAEGIMDQLPREVARKHFGGGWRLRLACCGDEMEIHRDHFRRLLEEKTVDKAVEVATRGFAD